MKTNLKNSVYVLALLMTGLFLTSCNTEDPGPLQYGERIFSVSQFNRLEMGSAFIVQVRQGAEFLVEASGDVRNLDDLAVVKSGSTLTVYYDQHRHANRKHLTTLYITMPELEGVNFSGASISDIQGFETNEQLSVTLSGASTCKLYPGFNDVKVNLSGASKLNVYGIGTNLQAKVSGASELRAREFHTEDASLDVSGASSARVSVSNRLDVIVSGASSVLYTGNPEVYPTVTGGSTLRKE
ncbi:MAG: DUF2807 domain-containing protein [Cyclobacteriaceae bacterium]|nr:DUF2807 domain-containing protein [Cyclobacteriaceae bacterium]